MSYLLNVKSDSDKKKINPNFPLNNFSNNLIVQDLDSFFKNIYDYYYCRGYSSVFTQTFLDNISFLFSIHFFLLNFYVIDWRSIITSCLKEEKCDLEISDFISLKQIDENFTQFVVFYALLISYYFLFLWKSLLFLYKMKKVKYIYDIKLRIKQKEMENLKFDDIIERLIELQKTENYSRIKQNLTKFDIVARILRKENFLIAMITNNFINMRVKIPFNIEISYMTNYLYHNLYECIMKFAFEKGESKLNQKITTINFLRIRLIIYLLIEIIFIPATIFFKLTFFLYRNADRLSRNTQTINRTNSRTKIWTPFSQLSFRNYNELQHHFEYRIDKSYNSVEKFMNCFKDRRISIFSKFIVIICGSFLILIFLISTIDDKLFTELKIFNKKIMLIGFVMGLFLGVFSTKAELDKNSDEDYLENKEYKDLLYKEIANSVINTPRDWTKSTNNSQLFKKISLYYENVHVLFLKEIFSVLIFPLVWIKIVFYDAANIVKFFKFYSKNVDGLGMIYSFSFFDLQNFKFFKERDISYSEWTFNDRKFLNSFIDFNEKFNSKEKDPDLHFDEDSVIKRQCDLIEQKLLENYIKEVAMFDSNTTTTRTRSSFINKSRVSRVSRIGIDSYEIPAETENDGSEYLFKSFIHYHISQMNLNELISKENEESSNVKLLSIEDSI